MPVYPRQGSWGKAINVLHPSLARGTVGLLGSLRGAWVTQRQCSTEKPTLAWVMSMKTTSLELTGRLVVRLGALLSPSSHYSLLGK